MFAVEVRDLVKRYPRRPVNAVDGISFGVRTGEVFGLLGPNGAGKTTTIGVLTTRVVPTSGAARVAGVDVVGDPVAARRRIAVVPQWNNLDRALNARENLVYHAAYHRIPAAERGRRASELLSQFGLGDRAGDHVDKLSGGQAQRLIGGGRVWLRRLGGCVDLEPPVPMLTGRRLLGSGSRPR